VAYALYKTAKREWIQNFRATNGRRPNEDECRSHSAAQTEAALTAYISQADQILAAYAADVINEERPKILEEALEGGFWRSFWPSFFSSVAFTVILVLLALIAALFGVGFPIQITIPSHQAATMESRPTADSVLSSQPSTPTETTGAASSSPPAAANVAVHGKEKKAKQGGSQH
jgi:hypothetical protein